MIQRLSKIVNALENSDVLSSVKKGFMLLVPILMTGSFVVLLQNFPLPQWQELIESLFGGYLDQLLNIIYDSTMGLMSVFLTCGVSYCYASTLERDNTPLHIMAMLASVACFAASFGAASGSMTLTHLGPIGVFTGMLCGIFATRLFIGLHRQFSKRTHYYNAGADIGFKSSMNAIFPMALCIGAFACVNLLIKGLFHVDNFNDLITGGVLTMFRNIKSELAGGALFVFLLNFLWLFGLHGGNVLEPVAQGFFAPAIHNPDLIISKSFIDNFAVMGGCGSTICLLLALLLFSRSRNDRKLARSALPFAAFNINEILVFGLPIVLNPILFLPFVLVPMANLLVSYLCTAAGLMPVVGSTVSWTTPALFSGAIATGSGWGVAVQLFNIVLGTAIYAPFVRLSDRMQHQRERDVIARLELAFQECERTGTPESFLDRGDALGSMAKALAGSLRADLERGQIPVYYQPQVDAAGSVVGAEALLRWRYHGATHIYPPLLVSLAQEDGSFDGLSRHILQTAAQAAREMRKAYGLDFVMSANLTAQQLNDPAFIRWVTEMVDRENVGGNFELEVTEETSLVYLDKIGENIELLRRHGVLMAVDDFSMGQTSLKYLQSNGFRYVKLDGGLVSQVQSNPRCRDIIASIVTLGGSLQFKVVAEHVETEEERSMLIDLGCACFQGYLFGKAMPMPEFLARFPAKAAEDALQSAGNRL